MHGARTTATALLCASALLAVPSFALADPGRPGLDSASTAVYSKSGEGGKTIKDLAPGDRGQVRGEERSNPSGRGNDDSTDAPFQTSGPSENTTGAGNRLPFTGFAAALVLALGMMALLLGSALRGIAARPGRA